MLGREQPSYEDMDSALEPLGWRRRDGTEDVARLAVLYDLEDAATPGVVLRIDAEHEGLFVTVRSEEG